MDEEHLTLAEKAIEFAAHRCERAGLDLDQEFGVGSGSLHQIDDESLEGHLEPVAGRGVVPLEAGMECALVQRADVGDAERVERLDGVPR